MPGATDVIGLLRTLSRAGVIAPLRPDRYLRMGAAMRREGTTPTAGFAAAAQRCPEQLGLVDELGTLTWRQLHQRCDAFAAALQALRLPAALLLGPMMAGGILAAVAAKYRLPVHFVGVGEGVDDLAPFAAKDFARALAGLER